MLLKTGIKLITLLRSETSQTSFSDLCGAESSISRTHGTEKEKEQPDWRKYRVPLEM